jgi:hypothetical protein
MRSKGVQRRRILNNQFLGKIKGILLPLIAFNNGGKDPSKTWFDQFFCSIKFQLGIYDLMSYGE